MLWRRHLAIVHLASVHLVLSNRHWAHKNKCQQSESDSNQFETHLIVSFSVRRVDEGATGRKRMLHLNIIDASGFIKVP